MEITHFTNMTYITDITKHWIRQANKYDSDWFRLCGLILDEILVLSLFQHPSDLSIPGNFAATNTNVP